MTVVILYTKKMKVDVYLANYFKYTLIFDCVAIKFLLASVKDNKCVIGNYKRKWEHHMLIIMILNVSILPSIIVNSIERLLKIDAYYSMHAQMLCLRVLRNLQE